MVGQSLPDTLIWKLTDHSCDLVVAALPKNVRAGL